MFSDYKALVYVYLNGGLSPWASVVPLSGYSTYAARRGALAIPQGSALVLNGTASDGGMYGLNPNLSALHTRFNAGKVALICNAGNLVQPTTLAQYNAGVSLPPQLFSHFEQTRLVQTGTGDAYDGFGWAGRLADYLAAQGLTQALPVNINIGGNPTLQVGVDTSPYAVTANGAISPRLHGGVFGGGPSTAANALLANARTETNPITRTLGSVYDSAISKRDIYNNAVAAAGDVVTTFPGSPLGVQLRQVARTIKARTQVNPPDGFGREIFFVQLGGFDSHDSEIANLPGLMAQFSTAVDVFLTEMAAQGVANNVMVLEQSDFGRTLTSNGDGSDHGWGTFYFAAGGPVIGGYYGQMPSLAIGGPLDVGQGRYIPTTSIDQIAATCAKWMGVPDSALNGIFPNLPNFATRDLGFLV